MPTYCASCDTELDEGANWSGAVVVFADGVIAYCDACDPDRDPTPNEQWEVTEGRDCREPLPSSAFPS